MSILDKIKTKLEESIAAEKAALLEDKEIELTEEEMEGLTEEEIVALKEAKKKSMKDGDDEMDDEEDDEMDDEEDDEVDVKESLAKIFADAKLDEKVMSDLETLFNVVVTEKVTKKCGELSDKYESELEEALQSMQESINKYISYTADEWLKENEIAVEKGIRQEISENLIIGLRDLFVENYVDVPEDKVDIVAEAETAIEDLTKKLDESKNETLVLKDEINKMKAEKIVDEVTTEMTDTEKAKFSELIAEIKYEDDLKYKEKILLVVETYFKDKATTEETKPVVNERMEMYLKHFNKK